MSGPTDAAGVKILLHDSSDVPLVKDLGLAIPPGSHAFLGLFMLKVKNLPPPYGQCDDSIPLNYFDHYTSHTCSVDRKLRAMTDVCGCIDISMEFSPPVKLPICNLTQYISCVVPLLETYRRDTMESPCPVPCDEHIYDPSVSYASISNFQVETLLNDREVTKLQRRNQNTFRADSETILKVSGAADAIQTMLEQMSKILQHLRHEIGQLLATIAPRVNFQDVALHKLWYSIHNGFVRGWEVMEERTFSHVTSGYQETLGAFEDSAIRSTTATPEQEKCCLRTVLFEIIDMDLLKKQYLALRALDNITAVHASYTNGTPIVNYIVTMPDERYDDTFNNPEMLQYHPYKQEYLMYLSSATQSYIDSIIALRNLSKNVLDNRYFNRTRFEEYKVQIARNARAFNYRKYLLQDRLVKRSEDIVNEKRERFNDSVTNLIKVRDSLYFLLKIVNNSLESKALVSWADVHSLVRYAEDYISNRSLTKTNVASTFLNESHVTSFQELRKALNGLHSRSRDITDSLEVFRKNYIAVWKTMLEEGSLQKFYQKLNSDVMLVSSHNVTSSERQKILEHMAHLLNTTPERVNALSRNHSVLLSRLNADFSDIGLNETCSRLNRIFKNLQSQSDLSGVMGTTDKQFLDAFVALKNQLEEYLKGNEIDAAFFRENFLQFDVFLKELQIEEIEQQKAYDINKLWSDIGGSLGLFVGASFLTLFEIADMLLHTALRRKLVIKPKTPAVPNGIVTGRLQTMI
ncbi:uncharacterized protein LOC106176287 [Lingula anatina]|uniref:Uncharacterized protein LOC106176287 n=1 Tax=Lingula anatina TaxID=7574 RepID=A0A1S3JUL3_LINAN|nr:uncharacterized protein LOC106176287 [Lingula anatina]|eukprot:XP_013414060.1 uncharacterized protein LOC106176287 [Lingula anatina]